MVGWLTFGFFRCGDSSRRSTPSSAQLKRAVNLSGTTLPAHPPRATKSGTATSRYFTSAPPAPFTNTPPHPQANPIAKKYRGRNLNHFPLLSLLVSDGPLPAHHALTLIPDCLPPPTTSTAATIITAGTSSASTHKRPRSPDEEDDSNEEDYKDAQEEEEIASSSSSGDDDGVGAVLTPGPKTPNGTHPGLKRLKRSFHALRSESASSNLALANALTQITQQLGMGSPLSVSVSPRTGGVTAAQDNVQAAIATLQNDYDKKMSVEDLVVGLSIFESEHKAKMFVAMKKGLVRDAWLMKEIRVYRGERGDM